MNVSLGALEYSVVLFFIGAKIAEIIITKN